MPGDETKNYDLVIEFAEQAYRDVLGALFDSDGLLCNLLDELEARIPGFPHLPCGAFSIDVLFDRPADVSLPPGAGDTIDIRMTLGEGGSVGSLRIVAGVDVNAMTVAGTQIDLVRVNLADKTYHASANVYEFPDPGGILSTIFTSIVRDLGSIPLLPVPVNRTTTSSTELRSADVRIIDDTSAEDRDASAVLLTFGSGAAGNRNAFTRSFIPAGETGGIAIDFNWICRILRPRLAEALKTDDTRPVFDPPCRLRDPIRVDDDEKVDLTRLELTLVDGAIQVAMAVRKDGTGYTATGTVTARIRMEVTGGNLVVGYQVDDPDIDVSLDWWVWLTAAALGAILGGVIGAVIGLIVAAVLGPLIEWLVHELIEGVIEGINERIGADIQNVNREFSAIGLNLIFQEVFLDDITIGCRVDVQDHSPVLAEGVITVRNGERFDLDNGTVGGDTLSGADMVWEGSGTGRKLRTLCDVKLARTGSTSFSGLSRYRMYALHYQKPGILPLMELAVPLPSFLDLFGFDTYQEKKLVYGVKTNEERYALMQVVHAEDDFVRIRYKTYEKRVPKIEIIGGFRYDPVIQGPAEGILTPELMAGALRVDTEDSRIPSPAKLPCIQPALGPQAVAGISLKDPCEEIKAGPKRLAKFRKPGIISRAVHGKFRAWVQGLKSPVTIEWSINKKRLEELQGEVTVNGLDLSFSIEGSRITLTPGTGVNASFELGATAKDNEGTVVSTSRCIEYAGERSVSWRATPSWTAYRDEFRKTFGMVEVPG